MPNGTASHLRQVAGRLVADRNNGWRRVVQTVGAYEAKTRLGQLLDEVARGETVTITKSGVPVAEVRPPGPAKPDVNEVIDALHEFRTRENISLDGISIRGLIEEGATLDRRMRAAAEPLGVPLAEAGTSGG